MEANQEISSPLFDFSIFYQDEFLSDCDLLVKNKDDKIVSTIRAHRIVLANSSDYFSDAFSSGTVEEYSRQVDLRFSEEVEVNSFLQIICFIYKGEIDFSFETFVPILHMARYFRVKALQEMLEQHLDQITKDEIIPLVTQCYDLQYPSELELFDKYIIKYFDEIPISALSDSLDVNTFCRIIQKMQFGVEKRIDIINQFISTYEPNDDERKSLLDVLAPINKELKNLVKSKNITWLPIKFLNTC